MEMREIANTDQHVNLNAMVTNLTGRAHVLDICRSAYKRLLRTCLDWCIERLGDDDELNLHDHYHRYKT